MENLNSYAAKALDTTVAFAPKVLSALILLIVGLWVINKFVHFLGKAMEKKEIDLSLQKFGLSLAGITLKVLLVISVASTVGIATTSFVAVLGAAGLAVGLALQGSLSNFAGGALILLFRLFRVGDFIEAQGAMGTVEEIQVFHTVLKSPDNKRIILPNGSLANGNITNFNVAPNRRIDWTFGIGYSDDVQKAKKVLKDIITADARALKDPEPMVVMSALGDSSVNFIVRAWVAPGDYWGLNFDIIEKVKLTFDKEGISIPFPQRDIHLYTHANGAVKPEFEKANN